MEKTITMPTTTIRIPRGLQTLTIKLLLVDDDVIEGKKKWGELDTIKGMLAKRKGDDPLVYQRKIRKEWR